MAIIFNEELGKFQARYFFDQNIVNFVVVIKNKACDIGIIHDEIADNIDNYFGEVDS